MKVLFMGGRPLGALCLDHLIEQGHEVMVVPNKDDKGEDTWFRSARKIATDNGLVVWEGNPNNLEHVEEFAASHTFDVAFSIIYTRIIRKEFLELFPKGCINVHYAPLPKYRGWWPVMRAIINGETIHATTMHYMAEEVDSGDIICQRSFPLFKGDTGKSAYDRGTEVSFEMFQAMLSEIEAGTALRVPQDHSEATYYPREVPNGGVVDLSKSEEEVYNFIRALTFPPFPGPKIAIGDQLYEINNEPA